MSHYLGGRGDSESESMALLPDIPRTNQCAGKTFLLPKECQEVYRIVSIVQVRLPKNACIPYHHVILMNSACNSHRLVFEIIFVVSQNSISRLCRHCKNRLLKPTIKCVLQTISLALLYRNFNFPTRCSARFWLGNHNR